jgi:hypothetical protein
VHHTSASKTWRQMLLRKHQPPYKYSASGDDDENRNNY